MQEYMDIENLKKLIKEEDLLLLYTYIEEFEESLSPETKAALYNLLCELDTKLLEEDEENNSTGS